MNDESDLMIAILAFMALIAIICICAAVYDSNAADTALCCCQCVCQ